MSVFRGKFRAKNSIWLTGGYCQLSDTTYCVTSDYERNPVKVRHYIAVDQTTDWGLPNKLEIYEVFPESVGQYAGFADKNGRDLFEGDRIRSGKHRGFIRRGCYRDLQGAEHMGFYVEWDGEDKTLLRPELPYWAEKCEWSGIEFDIREQERKREEGE